MSAPAPQRPGLGGQLRVALLGSPSPLADALAVGLRALAVHVVELSEAGGFGSGQAVADQLEEAAGRAGGLDGVVDATVPVAATVVAPLSELTAEQWELRAEAPLRHARHVMQGACRFLRRDGGSIVVLLPTFALTGAAALSPWTAAAEGYRSLAKACARAGGGAGVRINCICLPTTLMTGRSVERPGLPPPSLPPPDVRRDVAPVVASMLGESFRAVTGQTLAVDGGVWMAS